MSFLHSFPRPVHCLFPAARRWSSSHPKISIPNRIERGPTDILKALATTVNKDFTAPHYKYMDDPFLIPQSNINRRAYALSRESGRRAAKYFMDKFPQFFFRDDAEPKVPAFSYKDSFSPDTEVDESDLQACISCRQVLNAVQVFNNCLKQKVKLSDETLVSLLQLLCFYNSQDGPDPDFIEENWFRHKEYASEKKKTWIDDGAAEQVYDALETKSHEAVNALICGYSRFNASEKAMRLFEDAKRNDVQLETETYNHILKMVPFVTGSGESCWEMILDILRDMRKTETAPNVVTFNEILAVLSRQQTWRQSRILSLRTMAEMQRLGIEPSLATLFFLLRIHAFDRTGAPAPEILYEMMEHLSGRELQIRDARDVNFFMQAMIVCNEQLCDVDLAYKIHELLCTGENGKLMGDAVKESNYYQNFVKLLTSSESMDGLMEFYEKYVPNTYIPEPEIMCRIIEAAAFHQSYATLSTLWSDSVSFEYATRDLVMNAMINAILQAEDADESTRERFVTIIEDLIKRFDEVLNQTRSVISSNRS